MVSDPYGKDIIGKSRSEILDFMFSRGSSGEHSSLGELERQKAGLMVACIKDAEQVMEDLKQQLGENAASSDRLAEKIVFLNRVLTVATVIAAIATVALAYEAFVPAEPNAVPGQSPEVTGAEIETISE